MKLVTFGIDSDRNLIIQFPVFAKTLHTSQTYFVPNTDSSSSHSGHKQQSTILYTTKNR